jgi:hypothetical protein
MLSQEFIQIDENLLHSSEKISFQGNSDVISPISSTSSSILSQYNRIIFSYLRHSDLSKLSIFHQLLAENYKKKLLFQMNVFGKRSEFLYLFPEIIFKDLTVSFGLIFEISLR